MNLRRFLPGALFILGVASAFFTLVILSGRPGEVVSRALEQLQTAQVEGKYLASPISSGEDTAFPLLADYIKDKSSSPTVVKLLQNPKLLINFYLADKNLFFTWLDEACENSRATDASEIILLIAEKCGTPQIALDWIIRSPHRLKQEGTFPLFCSSAFITNPGEFSRKLPEFCDIIGNEMLLKSICGPIMTALNGDTRNFPLSKQAMKEAAGNAIAALFKNSPDPLAALQYVPQNIVSTFDVNVKSKILLDAASKLSLPSEVNYSSLYPYISGLSKRDVDAIMDNSPQEFASKIAGSAVATDTFSLAEYKNKFGSKETSELASNPEIYKNKKNFENEEVFEWLGVLGNGKTSDDFLENLAPKIKDPVTFSKLLHDHYDDGDLSSNSVSLFLNGLINANEAAASEVIRSMLDEGKRIDDYVISNLVKNIAKNDPEAATLWSQKIRDPELKQQSAALIQQ